MTTENGLQPTIGPLRRLSILSLRSRNSVHISQEELLLLDECKRMVKEVHRRVAAYKDLLLSLGNGDRDSSHLREEVRKLRRQCIDLCRKAKTRMLPTLRSTTPEQNEQLYKYFYQLVSCLQIFLKELEISFALTKDFPIHLPTDQKDVTANDKCTMNNQHLINLPTICVAGENISVQINISDPSNNEITPSIEIIDDDEDAEVIDPTETQYPELARIRMETQEVRDLFFDISDLIPVSKHSNDVLVMDDIILGRKTKTKLYTNHRSAIGMCCTCRPEYL